MTKSVEKRVPDTKVKAPTFSFEFHRSEAHPKEYTARYFRDGELFLEVKDAEYIVCAAQMERKMRLAIFE